MLNGNHVLNYLYQFHEPYINFPFVFYRLAISILFKNTEFQLQFFFFFHLLNSPVYLLQDKRNFPLSAFNL